MPNPYNTFPIATDSYGRIDTSANITSTTTYSNNNGQTINIPVGTYFIGSQISYSSTSTNYDGYGMRFNAPRYVGSMPERQTYEVLPAVDNYTGEPYTDWSTYDTTPYIPIEANPTIRPSDLYGSNRNLPRPMSWEQQRQMATQELQAQEDARIFRALEDYAAPIPAVNIKVNINDGTSWVGYNDGLDWIGAKRPLKVGDIVDTPMGKGLIYIIDEDVYCVELDPTSNILHEFSIDELKKHEL